MQKETGTPPAARFQIPVDLLKAFKTDIRFVPNHLPVAGYIIFDRQMLESILLNDDPKARAAFAAQLGKVYQAGGELVVMAV
jgi:hypothetical protein